MKSGWTSILTPRVLAEAGVMIALAYVLSLVKIWHLPQGGSVTAAGMAPLLLLAIRRGPVVGIVAGIVYGIVDAIGDPYILTPVQFALDYPIAFGLLGVAGLLPRWPIAASLVAIFLRFAAHVVSGVVFFASYAGDQNVWIYSIVYNGSYLLPDFIICAVVLQLLALRGVGGIATPQRPGAGAAA